jgi:hypothetical protein
LEACKPSCQVGHNRHEQLVHALSKVLHRSSIRGKPLLSEAGTLQFALTHTRDGVGHDAADEVFLLLDKTVKSVLQGIGSQMWRFIFL